jgi:hypothetical protein
MQSQASNAGPQADLHGTPPKYKMIPQIRTEAYCLTATCIESIGEQIPNCTVRIWLGIAGAHLGVVSNICRHSRLPALPLLFE